MKWDGVECEQIPVFRRIELTSPLGTVISFVAVGSRQKKKKKQLVRYCSCCCCCCSFVSCFFAVVSANAAEPYNLVLGEAKERGEC